jgi:regulator of nonsense transcripts 1
MFTVDSCQGREMDYVILSCVRTNNASNFIAKSNRMNVTLTRARHGMVVVGNL